MTRTTINHPQRKILKTKLITAALLCALTITSAQAQEKTPGFNQKIPEKIMTPDKVETRIGTLKFVDGVPTAETTQNLSVLHFSVF